MLKPLFVCTANIDRSATGEDIFRNQARFEVKSWDRRGIGYSSNLEGVDRVGQYHLLHGEPQPYKGSEANP